MLLHSSNNFRVQACPSNNINTYLSLVSVLWFRNIQVVIHVTYMHTKFKLCAACPQRSPRRFVPRLTDLSFMSHVSSIYACGLRYQFLHLVCIGRTPRTQVYIIGPVSVSLRTDNTKLIRIALLLCIHNIPIPLGLYMTPCCIVRSNQNHYI